ncbi:MAG: terminase large subunit [Sulfurimonas sp.]|nr:terminase large subunit [Sulfurimonas sp.]
MYDYSTADKIIKFAESLKVPEGAKVGEKIKLIPYQIDFIREVFKTRNGKRVVKLALMSLGRKNAKSTTIAIILLALMAVKGLAKPNAQIASGARSRDQAALIYNLMKKFIMFSPELQTRLKIIDSKKLIINMSNGCEFTALSADASNALGRSLYFYVHDETANLKEDSTFPEALMSSQGAYDDSLCIHISTIGASDTYYFNQMIEQYKDNLDESVHCIFYTVPEGTKGIMTNPKVWALANPALNFFLSEDSMRAYAEQAKNIPSKKAHFLNFMMNQKISADKSFIQASDWRAIKQDFEYSDYYGLPAVVGIDLSLGRYDLTSLVVVVRVGADDYKALPYTFSAKDSLEENATRLKVPLQALSMDKKEHLLLSPGITFDWEFMAAQFIDILTNFDVVNIGVDTYKWNEIQREFDKQGYSAPVEKLRQGFISFTSYVSALENMIYEKKIAHNGNFLLGYGLSNCIVVTDPANNKKLMKRSENSKIDPAVALAMAAYLAEKDLAAYDDDLVSFAII